MFEHCQSCHRQAQGLVAVRQRLISLQRTLQGSTETNRNLTKQSCTFFRELVIFQLHILKHLVHIQPLYSFKIEQVWRNHLDGVAIDIDKYQGIVTINRPDIITQRSKIFDVPTYAILGIMVSLHHLGIFIKHGSRLASYIFHAIRAHDDIRHLRRSLNKN